MPMKLAYSSNAYMRFDILEAINRIASLGYGGIELMADVPHAWPMDTSDELLREIRRTVADRSLTISNINAFMMNAVKDFWHPSWIEPDAAFRRLRLEHTKRALSMARKLGATCITTEPGGPLPDGCARSDAVNLFVDGLREVLLHAEDEGIMLLVEPEPGLLIETADQFLEIAAQIDSPMFGLNFDVGHFYCVNEQLPETIERLKGWTRHYHLEDMASSRIHEHLIPGRGAIDFPALVQAIKRTNYRGWLTVELYPYLDDPDAAGHEAREFLTSIT